MTFLVIGFAMLAHGWSLTDQFFFDDHWHRFQYQNDQWGVQDLLNATTIEPARFMHSWWQDKVVRWEYSRPFAILTAKILYHLTHEPVSLHAFSLALHIVAALLVYALCWQLTRQHFWSTVGALLFVVYSHSIYAVAWLAAQNSVLQTTLTLAALLLYVRASGLNLFAARQSTPDDPPVPPVRTGAWLGMMLCWLLALFSRENAIVLPVFAAGFDLCFGGWRYVRRRWVTYVLFVVIAVGFFAWRMSYFQTPMPDFYVRRPDGLGYVGWWLAKLMHYLCAAVWLSPLMLGPTVRFNPFAEVPGDCLLMLVILVVLGGGYVWACRKARGWWLWLLWIFLSVLPVVHVMATPHSGYMPAVGFAVGMILGPALRKELQPGWIARICPGVAIWFLIATNIYVPIYRSMWCSVNAAERLSMAGVRAAPPASAATDVFFINLPFVNIYARLHMDEILPPRATPKQIDAAMASIGSASVTGEVASAGAAAMAGPRCHVLTYAPNVLQMDESCCIEQLDTHRFRLSINGTPYFSGAMGRFLIEGMRSAGRFKDGDAVQTDEFRVEVVRADVEGVWELQFTFAQPLSSPQYCFYTCSETGTARVLFSDQPDGSATVVTPSPIPTGWERWRDMRSWLFRIHATAARILSTDLYFTGPKFPGPR